MTTTHQHTFWTNNPIKLPDGHRLFEATGGVYIGSVPAINVQDERGLWAMADESGDYPHDTDDGVLWLDFSRVLDAGAPARYVQEAMTPTIPLLDKTGKPCSTITDTSTLLVLSARFQWDINVLASPYRAVRI